MDLLSFLKSGTILLVCLIVSIQGSPLYEDEQSKDLAGVSPSVGTGKKYVIQSVMGRNKVRDGDVDPQTQNDLRILSLFEHELNKIFSCYVRLSCPRTRNPKVIEECQEIRDWPLYHQVMRMANIKRYPYQNYAPTASASNNQPAAIFGTSQTDHHTHSRRHEHNNAVAENEIEGSSRSRQYYRRQRRHHHKQTEQPLDNIQ